MSKKKKQNDSDGVSITQVVIGIMIVIAVMGWGAMASSYVGAHSVVSFDETSRPRMTRISAIGILIRALIEFVIIAVQQLPNLFSVIGWHLGNRIWLPSTIIALEGAALFFGFGLKSMEGHLDDPYARHRAKRKSGNENTQSSSRRDSSQRKRKKKRRPGS
ncbi:hypothetical protein [Thalassoglobus polymorphus]|uniref:Uncharacterized protein n=1 Tax=Thalassoglobus polymorphus TaxID=2527994 RepID=A0A517QSI0_9PLAN|nr:hypothetical protein [Thalassoglobus polymorphus]QDT34596.1 hypothetical protein Mal48_38590 [Thalassoglobus polymorphus]